MLLASLCFVHCVAGPILLSYAGFSSLIGVSEKVEPLFLLASGATGIVAFVPAYRKKHRRKSCLALFGFGLLCLLLRRYIAPSFVSAEPVATGLGASLIIGAHLLNLRFSKRCQCCESLSETLREATHASGFSVPAPEVRVSSDGIPDLPISRLPERNK
jgi:hypothetical protein